MDKSQIAPELRRIYRFLPNPPIRRTWSRRLTRRALRLPLGRPAAGVMVDTVTFGPGSGVRVYTPARGTDGGALLYIHGGGLVIGSARQEDAYLSTLARTLRMVAVSVEYRLAPDHPFPAPLDDCLAAWDWLQDNAVALGIDPARIAVGGQSGGGGLAAALAQRLHDRGGTQPVAQWLYCPMLDDRTAARRDLDEIRHILWDNRSNRFGWGAYLATEPGAQDVPAYAVPARRTDLTGLPPAWIGVGTIELFYDEVRRYAQALQAAGVDCTLDVVPGAPHAVESLGGTTTVATEFRARAEKWLADRLKTAD